MTIIQDAPPSAASPPPPNRRSLRRRWRFSKLAFGIAVIALVGVLMLLYPTVAAWLSQYHQSRLIDAYSEQVREMGPQGQEHELEDAAAYNAALVGGASVAANERIPLSDGTAEPSQFDYDRLLRADSTGLMARVKIPAISVDLPIYHGTTDDVLLRGVGHLKGTALPVGGAGAHSVLTAHRGLASAELFSNLDRVEVGDTFTIEVFGEVLTYRVRETKVVKPDQTETLYPQRGNDLVTLVTCTPLGINSHRILVTGERILPTPIADVEAAGERPDVPGFPWWTLAIGGALVALTGYVYLAGRPGRPGARRVSGG